MKSTIVVSGWILNVSAFILIAFGRCKATDENNRNWNVVLETCSDPQSVRTHRQVERFLDDVNATHRLLLVRCNNPVAMMHAVESLYSTGVTHFVVAATSATLDLSSHSTFPPGATLDYFTLDDFLFLYQWNRPNFLSRLLRSVFLKWTWKYIYFYVDSYYETSLRSNVHLTQEVEDPYVVEQLNLVKKSPPQEFVSNLKTNQVRHVRSIVVAANESVTLDVVKEGSEKGLLSSEHQWIVFFNGNLTALFGVLKLRANSNFYVIRHASTVNDLTDVLLEYLKFHEMSLLGPAENPTDGVTSAWQTQMLWTEDAMGVDIFKLFLNEDGFVSSRVTGNWDPQNGLTTASSSRYPNYQKRTLKVVTAELFFQKSPPYVIIQQDSAGVLQYSGYLVDLLMVVSSLLNFTIEYIPVKIGPGSGSTNSSWNGVIEALVHKNADIGLYDLAISPERLLLVDFAEVAVDTQFTSGLFRRPGSEGNDKFGVYLEPFDLHVWVSSIVTVFLLVASLYFSTWITKKVGGEIAERWDNDDVNVSRTVLLGFQAVAQQGCELNFGNPSTRIIFVVLWLFALICYASYSATLMSYLTITKVVLPFTSLPTLARNMDYKIGFLDGSSHLEMFRDSSSAVYQSVWKRVLSSRFTNVVDDYSEGVGRVMNEKFVLLSDDKSLRYVARNTCELVVSEPLTSSQFVTLGFQKDSPHQEGFSRALRLMTDAGVLFRLRDKWWGSGLLCQQESQLFMSLSLTNVATGFLLLVAGFVIGGLALATEAILRACGCVATAAPPSQTTTTARVKVNRYFGHRPRLQLHY